jgi:hypothetical protein
MAQAGGPTISLEEFRFLAERAGLGLSDEELEELKPLYELYLPHIQLLHTADLKAEEISLEFHPDWPG